jgi:hypothetical protein
MRRRVAESERRPSAALATIERFVTVRMLDISRAGCLLESPCQLSEGTVGMLEVEVGPDERYEDPVRVERATQLAGSGETFRVGVRFLWSDSPGGRSLRSLAVDLPAGAARRAAVQRMRGVLPKYFDSQ